MAHPLVAPMIGAGLEGCGPSQPLPAVNLQRFTAPTERAPSREPAGNGPSVGGNDDRWRPGGLRSLAAVAGRKPTPFHGADGADTLQNRPAMASIPGCDDGTSYRGFARTFNSDRP